MGVFGSIWDIGHASGPIAFGFILFGLGYRTAWLLMAAVMAAAVVVFLLGSRKEANRTAKAARCVPGITPPGVAS